MDDDPFETLRTDPKLGPLVEEYGELEVTPADDPFARLVVAICNQQLSQASAAAIEDRLFDRFEVTPAGILAAERSALREAGLSGQKVEYVRNVAHAFETDLSVAALETMDDDAVRDTLTEIRGIGPWTADIFLMFVLGRQDVFPEGDLGIRKAMATLYGFDVTDRAGMVDHASRWRPYRTYASRYLWRVHD